MSGAGDVNGDNTDDLVIGAWVGPSATGASHVIFGSDQRLPVVIDLATDADVVILGPAVGDGAGWAVSGAGDVNGDGIDDLIIGARPLSLDDISAGTSHVVFGSDQGLPGFIDLATDADVAIRGALENEWSGFSVSGAGDVDGDDIDDLIIGAQRSRTSYVVFGSDQGLPAFIELATDANLVIRGAGFSVSGAGDVNGDSIDDVIIGGDGASYVILGSDQGLPAFIDLATEPTW